MGTKSGQQTPNGYPSLGALQLSHDLIILPPNLLTRVRTTKWSSNLRYSLSYAPITSHHLYINILRPYNKQCKHAPVPDI